MKTEISKGLVRAKLRVEKHKNAKVQYLLHHLRYLYHPQRNITNRLSDH